MIFNIKKAHAPYNEKQIDFLLEKNNECLFFISDNTNKRDFLNKFYYFFNNLIDFSLQNHLVENAIINKNNELIVSKDELDLQLQYYFYEIVIKEICQHLSFQDLRFCPQKALQSIEEQESWIDFTDGVFNHNQLFGYDFFHIVKHNILKNIKKY